VSAAAVGFEEDALGKAIDRKLLARLWRWVAPSRGKVLLTLLLVFPMFLAQIAPAWVIKNGLDREIVPVLAERGIVALEQAPATGGPPWLMAILSAPPGVPPLWWLGGLACLGYALFAALQYAQLLVMVSTGQAAMRDLRCEVFEHIQRLHMGFFDSHPVGRLVTRTTSDVEHLGEMFSAGLVLLVTDVLRMVGFAVVLFLADARLALFTLLVVPPMALAMVIFRLKVREAFRRARIFLARINANIQESVTGMKVVQLFNRERRSQQNFEALNGAHRDAWLQSIRYDSALFSVVELASGLVAAIVIAQAFGSASAGTIFFFLRIMTMFFMPLRDLSQKYSVMQSAMASLGGASARCCRMCFCLAAALKRTCRWAAKTFLPRRFAAPPRRWTPTASSASCPRATAAKCASAAQTSRRGSSSCSPSPARLPTAQTFWCWTKPPVP